MARYNIFGEDNDTSENDNNNGGRDNPERKKSSPDKEKASEGESFTLEIDAEGHFTIKKDGKVVGTANIRGPKGDKGEQGDTGPRGDMGPQGEKGVTGDHGYTWTPVITDDGNGLYFKNADGERYPKEGAYNIKGPRGEQGVKGESGDRGERGPKGESGVNGDTWTPIVSEDGETLHFENQNGDKTPAYQLRGKQGEQGIQGQKGERGIQGPAGPDGVDGETWKPVITADGQRLYFENSRGERTSEFGIRGPRGEQGIQGIPGIKGTDGRTFTPHIQDDWLWFEDENGNKPFSPINLRGADGKEGRPGKSAYELWRDDPLHPENADKSLDDYLQSLRGEDGHNVQANTDYTKLKDWTCPVSTINPHMMLSTDSLNGADSAEKTIEAEKARIDSIRKEGEKDANHGSWIQEFFWWCAGADRPLLRMCPGEHSKYMGIGTVIFFTALMAWFSSFIAMQLVFKEQEGLSIGATLAIVGGFITCAALTGLGYWLSNRKRKLEAAVSILCGIVALVSGLCYGGMNKGGSSAIFATFWALMIFFLDRFITNTMYSDGKVTISWLELRSALPRIVIAIFLGIVISAPLELKIFEQEINDSLNKRFRAETTSRIEEKLAQNDSVILAQTKVDQAQAKYDRAVDNYNRTLDSHGDSIYCETKNVLSEKSTSYSPKTNAVNGQSNKYHGQKVYNPTLYDAACKRDSIKAENAKGELALEQDALRDLKTRLKEDWENGPAFKPEWLAKNAGLYDQLAALHGLAYPKSKTAASRSNSSTQKADNLAASRSLAYPQSKTTASRSDLSAQKTDSLAASPVLAYSKDDTNKEEYNDGYSSWDKDEDYIYYQLAAGGIVFLLLLLICGPFYGNAISTEKIGKGIKDKKKLEEEIKRLNRPFSGANWWRGVFAMVPWFVIIAIVCALCCETLFHALPTYIFSAVGMIMMLFILIDVSPVFYKMMLADGVYDKLQHKEKLLAQDAMRLSAAKNYQKVKESEVGRLAPFVFGHTADKIAGILEDSDSRICLATDGEEHTGNQSGKPSTAWDENYYTTTIDKRNRELFNYVLGLKERIVKASYLAWYRDSRDHHIGLDRNTDTVKEVPEDLFDELNSNLHSDGSNVNPEYEGTDNQEPETQQGKTEDKTGNDETSDNNGATDSADSANDFEEVGSESDAPDESGSGNDDSKTDSPEKNDSAPEDDDEHVVGEDNEPVINVEEPSSDDDEHVVDDNETLETK